MKYSCSISPAAFKATSREATAATTSDTGAGARVEPVDADDTAGWRNVMATLRSELRWQLEHAYKQRQQGQQKQRTRWLQGYDGQGHHAQEPGQNATPPLFAGCAGLASLAAWLVHVDGRDAGASQDGKARAVDDETRARMACSMARAELEAASSRRLTDDGRLPPARKCRLPE